MRAHNTNSKIRSSYAREERSSEVTLLASSRVACKCYRYSTRAVCAREAPLMLRHGSLSGTPTCVRMYVYARIAYFTTQCMKYT